MGMVVQDGYCFRDGGFEMVAFSERVLRVAAGLAMKKESLVSLPLLQQQWCEETLTR